MTNKTTPYAPGDLISVPDAVRRKLLPFAREKIFELFASGDLGYVEVKAEKYVKRYLTMEIIQDFIRKRTVKAKR